MTEEEKKAFKWLDHIIDAEYPNPTMVEVLGYKNIIFNYVEKQQKEIEEYKTLYKERNEELNFENKRCTELAIENQDLREKNMLLMARDDMSTYMEFKTKYIPKSKIEEKLKDTQERAKKYYEKQGVYHNCNMCNNTCNWYKFCITYKELLESEE